MSKSAPKDIFPEFNFNKDLEAANNIMDLQDRLIFLMKKHKEFKQFVAKLKAINFDPGLRFSPDMYQDEIIFLKAIMEKPTKQKGHKKKTTYKWQGNAEKELPELYSLMKDTYTLIASDTTIEQFIAVFTGQQVNDSLKPIEWSVKKNLLAYFIVKLYSIKKIREIYNPDKWDIAKKCFLGADNLSQLTDLYQNNKTGLPRHHNTIDELINAL